MKINFLEFIKEKMIFKWISISWNLLTDDSYLLMEKIQNFLKFINYNKKSIKEYF